MKLISKAAVTLLLLALAVLSYFTYTFLSERYPKKNNAPLFQNNLTGSEPAETDGINPESAAPNDEEAAADESLDEVPDSEPDESAASDEFLEITRADCESGCAEFSTEDAADLEYCRQVCGLAPSKRPADDNESCARFSGMEKDYCLKDLAIRENDGGICDQIKDKNIRKTCRNRVLEDFVDEQIINSRQE